MTFTIDTDNIENDDIQITTDASGDLVWEHKPTGATFVYDQSEDAWRPSGGLTAPEVITDDLETERVNSNVDHQNNDVTNVDELESDSVNSGSVHTEVAEISDAGSIDSTADGRFAFEAEGDGPTEVKTDLDVSGTASADDIRAHSTTILLGQGAQNDGGSSVIIGDSAESNTSRSVVIGPNAYGWADGSDEHVIIGSGATNDADTGSSNVVVGEGAAVDHVDGDTGGAVVIGRDARLGTNEEGAGHTRSSVVIGRNARIHESDSTVVIGNGSTDQSESDSSGNVLVGQSHNLDLPNGSGHVLIGRHNKVESSGTQSANVAIGREVDISETESTVAMGYDTTVDNAGHSNIVMGRFAELIDASQSVVMGRSSSIDDAADSVAIGRNATVEVGDRAVAVGNNATIEGGEDDNQHIAIGNGSYIQTSEESGSGCIAIGTGATIDATDTSSGTIAIGRDASADQSGAIALGRDATAVGEEFVVYLDSTQVMRIDSDGNLEIGGNLTENEDF